jgi:hypothetical protein
MSISNVSDEMQRGSFPAPSTTVVKIINVQNTSQAKHSGSTVCLLAYGTTVPSGVSGYLSACLFIDPDAAADSQLLINEGTLSSCTFNGMS